MNSLMTVSALQQKCIDLTKRIGPKAAATLSIGAHRSSNYLFVMPDYQAKECQTFYGADWCEMFEKAETWLASRPNPDAEFASWFAPADAVAGE